MLLFTMTGNVIWPLRANGTVSLIVRFQADTVKELAKRRNGGFQLLMALGIGGEIHCLLVGF